MITILALVLTSYLVIRTKDYYYRSRFLIQHIRLKEESIRYRECLLVPPFLLYHYNFRLVYLYASTPAHPVVKSFQRELSICLREILSETIQHKRFVPESPKSPSGIFHPVILKQLSIYLALPLALLLVGYKMNSPVVIPVIVLSLVLLGRSTILLYHLFCLHPVWIERKLAGLSSISFSSKSHLQMQYRTNRPAIKKDLKKVPQKRNQFS